MNYDLTGIKKPIKYFIFIFPFVFIIGILIEKLINGAFGSRLFRFLVQDEDGPIEYATSFAYFAAFILAIFLAISLIRSKSRVLGILYFVFAFFLITISLEEISYGQRILVFETPDLFNTNIQGETTLHNLSSIQKFMPKLFWIIGFYGSTAWIFSSILGRGYKKFLKYIMPGPILIGYFASVFAFFSISQFTPQEYISVITFEFSLAPEKLEHVYLNLFWWKDQEEFEFLLSLGILFFVLLNYISQKYVKKNSQVKNS